VFIVKQMCLFVSKAFAVLALAGSALRLDRSSVAPVQVDEDESDESTDSMCDEPVVLCCLVGVFETMSIISSPPRDGFAADEESVVKVAVLAIAAIDDDEEVLRLFFRLT